MSKSLNLIQDDKQSEINLSDKLSEDFATLYLSDDYADVSRLFPEIRLTEIKENFAFQVWFLVEGERIPCKKS